MPGTVNTGHLHRQGTRPGGGVHEVRHVGHNASMRVHLGSDHAGFELKAHLVQTLRAEGHAVTDHGPTAFDPADDYPPYCIRAAEAVLEDPGSLGVVIGGSGNGEQISANKVRGVRAALAWSEETARLAREHNDAHVVAVGARMHGLDEATGMVRAFLGGRFSGDPRHQRRIDTVARYDQDQVVPPLPPEAGRAVDGA